MLIKQSYIGMRGLQDKLELTLATLRFWEEHVTWDRVSKDVVGYGNKWRFCYMDPKNQAYKGQNIQPWYVLGDPVCRYRTCNDRDECPHGNQHEHVEMEGWTSCAKPECKKAGIWSDSNHCSVWTWRACKEYEGWSNSATYLFALYFGQEQKLMEELSQLARASDGKVHPHKAGKLFHNAWLDGRMVKVVDEWVEGPVNVPEILEYFGL